MDSQVIECWNCGQSLRVSVSKLAVARCGNCQQKMVMEEESKPTEATVSQYQTKAKMERESELFKWIKSYTVNVLVGLCVLGVCVFVFIAFVTRYGFLGVIIGVVVFMILMPVINVISKAIVYANRNKD